MKPLQPETPMKDIARKIAEEVGRLPDPLAQEVLDFVQYLEYKHGIDSRQIEDLKQAQKPVMDGLWKNESDEVWNDL